MPRRFFTRIIVLSVTCAFAGAAPARAQVPAPADIIGFAPGEDYKLAHYGQYSGGKWIDIVYGRPILRGRTDMFGTGDEYATRLYFGAPIWRIGADVTTRITTEADLIFDGKTLPAGEYSMFADLAPDQWTLVFSTLGAKESFQEETPNAVWGGYGYTDDLDVLRASMTVAEHPVSADQLIITFTDMTQQGGNLTIWFGHKIATIPFQAR